MVPGLVLLSSLLAAMCGGMVLLFGGSFMSAFGVYMLTGISASIVIVARAIYVETKTARQRKGDFLHDSVETRAIVR